MILNKQTYDESAEFFGNNSAKYATRSMQCWLETAILNEEIKAVYLALIHPIPSRCVSGLNPRF